MIWLELDKLLFPEDAHRMSQMGPSKACESVTLSLLKEINSLIQHLKDAESANEFLCVDNEKFRKAELKARRLLKKSKTSSNELHCMCHYEIADLKDRLYNIALETEIDIRAMSM
ncbi:hypothetical protein PanWU01x14_297400 [Parasponia andersonii]|uniref:Uncharacterized protein n=1 Tax=Parasponia andersonii TaxID=3476 RepID=A0A2P5AV31_PARAD|nr:hypothetical protein PanWU01x14_297400 [Parasponia andersonii]